MEEKRVEHPQLGNGILLKTYMSGYEWEVLFESGRKFRLPAREFETPAAILPERLSSVHHPLVQHRKLVLTEEQFRARQTLEALRFGIVPMQDVETMTIGLEAEAVSLSRALARSHEQGGEVMAVLGDYGFGKSHFIELAARRALRENFVVMDASLDLVEVPPGKPYEIYRNLTISTRYPDTDERGLSPLLKKAQQYPAIANDFRALSSMGERCPLARAIDGTASCNFQTAYDDLVLWISGQIRATKNLRACLKKPPTLYKVGDVARLYTYLLTGLSQLATMLGYRGLVVLLDESEHYSLLRKRQRGRADSFFQSMIYAANGSRHINADDIPQHFRVDFPVVYAENPNLFFLFALTESESKLPIDEWLSPRQCVRLDDRYIERDIRKFFRTVKDYHGLAYDYEANNNHFNEVIDQVPGMLSRTLSQHRVNLRELIRTSVAIFDLLYLYDDYTVDMLLQDLGAELGS